jgi:hypothetical protein
MFHRIERGHANSQFNSAPIDLKAELVSMQARLAQLASSCENSTQPTSAGAKTITEADVRQFIAWRAKRSEALGGKLFADPAWDMLLELFAAAFAGQRVSVTALCIAANVPATTALRWLKILEGEGLAVRSDDPLDGRRSFVSLSKAGEAKLNAFFSASSFPALALS